MGNEESTNPDYMSACESDNGPGTPTSGTSADKLVAFGPRVGSVHSFWRDNVSNLEQSQLKVLGLLLFSGLFKKSKDARDIFTSTDIQRQSLRLLDMFEWLLDALNTSGNKLCMKTLHNLGERHIAYGVKPEFFRPMCEALSDALGEMFPNDYTEEIQQTLEELFQKASEEMMVKVLKKQAKLQRKMAMSSKKKTGKQLPRFLTSLEHCLADPIGFHYLAIFMNEKYPTGIPLLEFHRAFQIYRSTLNHKIRREIAHEICLVFLKPNSKLMLAEAPTTNAEMLHYMNNMDALKKEYPLDLFDSLHSWTVRQIVKYWSGFLSATVEVLSQKQETDKGNDKPTTKDDKTNEKSNETDIKDDTSK